MGQVACKVSPPTTSIAKHRPKLIFKLKFNLMVSGYFHHLRARSTLTRPLLSLESPLAFVHIEISFMSKFWPMMCRKKILGLRLGLSLRFLPQEPKRVWRMPQVEVKTERSIWTSEEIAFYNPTDSAKRHSIGGCIIRLQHLQLQV